MQTPVGLGNVAQNTIFAKAYGAVALVRFDVDVRGPLTYGLGQQRVNHADDWCVVLAFQQVFHSRHVCHEGAEVDFLPNVRYDFRRIIGPAIVKLRQLRFKSVPGQRFQCDGDGQGAANLAEHAQVGIFPEQDMCAISIRGAHQNAVVFCKGVG